MFVVTSSFYHKINLFVQYDVTFYPHVQFFMHVNALEGQLLRSLPSGSCPAKRALNALPLGHFVMHTNSTKYKESDCTLYSNKDRVHMLKGGAMNQGLMFP